MKNRFIYIIGEDGSSYIKIGVSENPKKRLSGLRSAHMFDLKIQSTYAVPYEYAFKIEKDIHTKLSPVKIRGEWVDLPVEDAKIIVEDSIANYKPLTLMQKVSKKREGIEVYANRTAVAAYSKKKRDQGFKTVKIWMRPETYDVYRALLDQYPNNEEMMLDLLEFFDNKKGKVNMTVRPLEHKS
jgi:hypothetical protein